MPPAPNPANSDPADDGSRNAAEFLRTRLRISIAEARRRLSLAAAVLPRAGFTGHTEPAERPELAAAVAAGTVAPGPRPSSPWPWTGSGTTPPRTPWPGWNTH